MADIFSQDTAQIKTFKLGKTLIQFGGKKHKNLVCNSAQFTYSQTVQPIVPLNKDFKYLIVGDATGQGSLSILMGPSEEVKEFIETYSKACSADNQNTITLMSPDGCSKSKQPGNNQFTLQGVVINSVSSQIQRGQGLDIMIATVQFIFNGMTMP